MKPAIFRNEHRIAWELSTSQTQVFSCKSVSVEGTYKLGKVSNFRNFMNIQHLTTMYQHIQQTFNLSIIHCTLLTV